MQIIKGEIFKKNLQTVLRFIAIDSKPRASKFNTQLSQKISGLPNMPYKSRKSLYYEDENVRDFVFKGYTIPYLIDQSNNIIVVLDIFKWGYRDEC